MKPATILAALVLSGAALVLPAAPVAAAESASLSIRLSGFNSADGQVLIAVYRGEDGFLVTPSKAWKFISTTITDGRASVSVKDVPPGDYAIGVIHDENGNNKLDTSWIGIPREGIGTSNNAKGRMGPPKYRDAKFEVTAAGAVQNIKMMYL